jgi:predicted SnoaL-like aldol condensation-catalyzing enzyme
MEADMATTAFAVEMGMDQANRYKNDERLYAQFFIQAIQDDAATLKEGRPIFKDTEFVRIMVPGDRDNIVVRPAHQQDKERFAKQYLAFKTRNSEVVEGTMLEHWPSITRAQVEELKFFHVRTVEQLATIADVHAQKFMGINHLRQQARDYMEQSKDNAPIVQMRAELEERDNKIESLEKAMNDMAEQLKALRENDA